MVRKKEEFTKKVIKNATIFCNTANIHVGKVFFFQFKKCENPKIINSRLAMTFFPGDYHIGKLFLFRNCY